MTTDSKTSDFSDSQVMALLTFGLSRPERQRENRNEQLLKQVAAEESGELKSVLLSDLQTPFAAVTTGPLGLARLTSVSEADVAAFEKHSLLNLLTGETANQGILKGLVEYGVCLAEGHFPESTQATGVAIQTLARAALVQRFGIDVSAADADATSETLQLLSDRQMPAEVQRAAQEKIERQSGR